MYIKMLFVTQPTLIILSKNAFLHSAKVNMSHYHTQSNEVVFLTRLLLSTVALQTLFNAHFSSNCNFNSSEGDVFTESVYGHVRILFKTPLPVYYPFSQSLNELILKLFDLKCKFRE